MSKDKGKKESKNPDSFALASLDKRVAYVELALFGEDGRGGMVKDVGDIKAATSAVKTVVVPIIISVVSAFITAGILLSIK